MSQALTVEKLPQSEGFLHKYESSAVYQEQQEFLESGKHVSLVGDSVEYLEVEPFDPNAQSEYYFTGENGQGLYTAKIPARFTDEYGYGIMATYDETVGQALADWIKSMVSQTGYAKVRGYAKWGNDGVPYSLGIDDKDCYGTVFGGTDGSNLGGWSAHYNCPQFNLDIPCGDLVLANDYGSNWSIEFQHDTESYPTSGDADAYISVEVEPYTFPNTESGGNS